MRPLTLSPRVFPCSAGTAQTFILARACVWVNEYESRAQPTQTSSQSVCSVRVTRCFCAPVPANGFRLVFKNACTELVTGSDIEQCSRMSFGGSKPVQPQRFSVVFSNARANTVHPAQAELRPIKVLRCSQPIQRNSLGVILRQSLLTSNKF